LICYGFSPSTTARSELQRRAFHGVGAVGGFAAIAAVSFHLVLRHIHDHARRQIKPRHDRLQLDVFGVVRVGAVAAQAEALDDGGGLQRGERGVGAAAGGDSPGE